jgi:pSer/pThr/pTyr-binding forkhead associated (FHA) protein
MAHLEYFVEGMRHEKKLDRAVTTVGRANGCSLQLLHDPELSRIHCSVRMRPDGSYLLQDENARNGTFLNGEQVEGDPVPLKEADRIRIGRTVLTFRDKAIGRTTMLFKEVEEQMEKGDGFHTIMQKIIGKKKPDEARENADSDASDGS